MRILQWHGYLLTGSGSNIYAANTARAWRRRGHDVLLLCQDLHAGELDFVDATGDFMPGNRDYHAVETGVPPATGRCTVVRPHIGEVLPVFVFDEYEGFKARLFTELTESELATYTSSNVLAVTTAIERHSPDAIITGHEVMGPEIARRACFHRAPGYLAKLHGSALEFAVKLQERYRAFAASGLGGAKVVVGGSGYMIREAASVVPGWEPRAAVVNPGCDVELFRPLATRDADRPLVAFVGKLISNKGVHNLLAAVGLTTGPPFHLMVIGYGGFAEGLIDLEAALRARDVERARAIAARGDGRPLDELVSFLGSGGADAAFLERFASIEVEFTGRLEHGPLSRVLPRADVLVVPSVVPEAFGMVAAEAASCGVLPIVPDHSGIHEAGRAVEDAIGRPGFLTFPAADPIRGIAAALDRVLEVPVTERADMGRAASELARETWSWDNVSERLLALAVRGNGGEPR